MLEPTEKIIGRDKQPSLFCRRRLIARDFWLQESGITERMLVAAGGIDQGMEQLNSVEILDLGPML